MEATVICFDNSERTRNGDYAPTRFQAQADAVNLLAGAKTQANPENTVGVMTMAGKSPRVLVTPTPDLGKILNSMQSLSVEGETNMATAVQIAQLALKHRQNKNQRQRIVIFIGSPISETKDGLVKIAKKLKKNNVAVDIVSFGDEDENAEKLDAFIEAVNANDNSHLVTVPAGTVLSDMLFGSPIFQTDGGSGYGAAGGAGGGGGGGDGFEFGVDPNLDPELALALRVSLEEERARQNAAQAAAGGGEGSAAAPAEGGAAAGGAADKAAAPAGGEAGAGGDAMALDDDELLQQALAMSMQVDAAPAPGGGGDAGTSGGAGGSGGGDEAMDDDLKAALAMSLEAAGAEGAAGGMDPVYLSQVLGALPGVDPSDPALAELLKQAQEKKEEGGDEGKEGGK